MLLSGGAVAGTPDLDKAVHSFADDPNAGYRYVLADLNADGIADALVLMRDHYWCGSGGCTMLIFEGTAEGFRFISRSTITREPIYLSQETSHGWRTLIVSVGGGGGKSGESVMRFNGREYPLNPSMQLQATAKEMGGARPLGLQD